MSMPELKKRQVWLSVGMLGVVFFNWLEYDSRVRIQEKLESEIQENNYNISQIKKQNKLSYNLYNKIMPSCLIQERKWKH